MPELPGADLEPQASLVRSRRRRLVIALVVLAGTVTVAAGIGATRNAKPDVVSRAWGAAPTFSLPSVREEEPTVSLERFRGRPVVLNFFASWCAPCQRELPAFNDAAQRYKGRVAFLGVSFNDDRPSARELLDKTGVRYPSAFDAESKLAVDYGLRGMPTTYFISAAGQLLARAEKPLTESQLSDVIGRLFDV